METWQIVHFPQKWLRFVPVGRWLQYCDNRRPGKKVPTLADSLTKAERSRQMSLVRSRNTKPEMIVRRVTFALGYRYRLHDHKLPGRPDLVFPSRQKVIFVHGCFWHRHRGCPKCRTPKTRVGFWTDKLEGNKRRDIQTKRMLTQLGWRYLVVWECETSDMEKPVGI